MTASNLTDRMRTCAAHLIAWRDRALPDWVTDDVERAALDAADLLIEASNRTEELEGLLRELIDIEGPQPGTQAWYLKVKAILPDAPAPLGEPMVLIKPVSPTGEPLDDPPRMDASTYQDRLRADLDRHPIERSPSPRACPQCDSRAAKRVKRDGRKLMLICPVCATTWEWKPKGEWV